MLRGVDELSRRTRRDWGGVTDKHKGAGECEGRGHTVFVEPLDVGGEAERFRVLAVDAVNELSKVAAGRL